MLEVQEPEIGPHEVLIEVKNAGICGTDLHIWHGSYALAKYPVVLGHEFSGVVAAVGREVKGFQVGERVTADPNLPCYSCIFCQRRQFNQCLNLEVLGVTRQGAFSRYVAAPESAVYPIGDLSFAEAALLEPLACVVWGLKQVQLQAGDTMLIFGAGPMGILMMQAVLRAGAASVVMVDKEAWRLNLARQLGATMTFAADALTPDVVHDLAPYGFDVVADATGVPKVIEQAFTYLRPGGKLWVFGVTSEGARVPFAPYEVFRKDLHIIGSFALNKTFYEAINLVHGGAIKLAPVISHILPLREFWQGLKVAEHDPARMKVQFAVDAT
ncbi:zinc-dependent alcohol dehydrogenase family protein [Truepera radiovictrix]|uniref:zinc-dependent alcohol dehydrogenase family protein n=1 Tax=Truepera radiovictrix TaxID=332249 RepID=UPI0028152224|nr:zinc-dependent alcohol dehydrogenase family protein [Truepera radiovictrix]WMT58382.1 zinc-dependent alcohol dehydrogenase family protein [Truepera radiovictrix]